MKRILVVKGYGWLPIGRSPIKTMQNEYVIYAYLCDKRLIELELHKNTCDVTKAFLLALKASEPRSTKTRTMEDAKC